MSSNTEAEESAILRPRLTHGAVRPCRGRADAARRLSRRPHSACLADRRRAAASARRRWPIAWRASCWPIPIRPCRRCRMQNRWPSRPIIRWRGASPARRTAIFWCCERVINEKTGKLFTVTRVDDIRRTVPFFGSTAGEGGWRVAIVDPLDDLNKSGRERAAQGAGGAAAARAAAARQPRAGPRAADHPLALPDVDAAPARRRRCRARGDRGDAARMPPPTKSVPRLLPPTARSGAR